MSETRSLVRKLAEVMAAVERIPKRGRNSFHNYDYATEGDIAATVRNELAKRHVMLIPAITGMQRDPVGEKGQVLTTLTMEFTFLDGETGETLVRPWLGAGTDKEDKGAYKAMTGGEKYFLLKTFLMPTGDDPEAHDAPTAHVGPHAATPPPKPAQQLAADTKAQQLAAEINAGIKAGHDAAQVKPANKFQQKVQKTVSRYAPGGAGPVNKPGTRDDFEAPPPITDSDIPF